MATRDDILAAAEKIMRTEGFARATTKQIAKEAGYSEAALYKHFADKSEIFLGVLGERLSGLPGLLDELAEHAGRASVWANLTRIARTALDFYIATFPIAVSVFSSQDLLIAHRNRLRQVGAGPEQVRTDIAGYLRAERDRGRINRRSDPDSAASLLIGACFQEAFLINFSGEHPGGAGLDTLSAGLSRTILDGLT